MSCRGRPISQGTNAVAAKTEVPNFPPLLAFERYESSSLSCCSYHLECLEVPNLVPSRYYRYLNLKETRNQSKKPDAPFEKVRNV